MGEILTQYIKPKEPLSIKAYVHYLCVNFFVQFIVLLVFGFWCSFLGSVFFCAKKNACTVRHWRSTKSQRSLCQLFCVYFFFLAEISSHDFAVKPFISFFDFRFDFFRSTYEYSGHFEKQNFLNVRCVALAVFLSLLFCCVQKFKDNVFSLLFPLFIRYTHSSFFSSLTTDVPAHRCSLRCLSTTWRANNKNSTNGS